MTNETTESKLANGVASSGPEEIEALNETYTALNESAYQKAKLILDRSISVNIAWAEFLPVLAQMQSLLSQRGDAREESRETGLPRWKVWLKDFQNQSGLNVSVRTVQKHLARYREIGKEKRQRSDRPAKSSRKDQERLPQTAPRDGKELVEALDNGVSFHEALREYIQTAVDPKYIERVLEAMPTKADANALSIKPAAPATATTMSVAIPPAITREPTPAPRKLHMPKPGNWSGLCDYVNDSCGEGIEAAFAGLEPVPMADNLGKFMKRIVEQHCRYNRAAGEIKVTVEFVRRKSSVMEIAA